MMHRILTLAVTIGALAYLSGCAGGSGKVSYLDPDSNDNKIVSVSKINQQDWGMMASKLIDSLVASGSLARADGRKSVITIGRIQNKTQEHIESEPLVKRIRVAVLRSGKAVTTTAFGVGGPEDASTMRVRKEVRGHEEFDQSTVAKKGTMKSPDFSLTGKIIQDNARAGKTKQTTFSFSMTLTDLKSGTAVWEDFREIIKQGKSNASVGF